MLKTNYIYGNLVFNEDISRYQLVKDGYCLKDSIEECDEIEIYYDNSWIKCRLVKSSDTGIWYLSSEKVIPMYPSDYEFRYPEIQIPDYKAFVNKNYIELFKIYQSPNYGTFFRIADQLKLPVMVTEFYYQDVLLPKVNSYGFENLKEFEDHYKPWMFRDYNPANKLCGEYIQNDEIRLGIFSLNRRVENTVVLMVFMILEDRISVNVNIDEITI